jgi:hypothetical protein
MPPFKEIILLQIGVAATFDIFKVGSKIAW